MSRVTHRRRSGAGAVAVAVVAAVLLSACAADPPTAPVRTPQDPDLAGAIRVTYSLYTHCGIRELTFAGQWYARTGGLLDDGNGNPPPGWGNPYQKGQLNVSGEDAVFTDGAGHRETFHLRPGSEASVRCS
jgi:hypothetical protein